MRARVEIWPFIRLCGDTANESLLEADRQLVGACNDRIRRKDNGALPFANGLQLAFICSDSPRIELRCTHVASLMSHHVDGQEDVSVIVVIILCCRLAHAHCARMHA